MILVFKNFSLLPELFFCLAILFLLVYGTVLSTTLKRRKIILKPIIHLSLLIVFFLIILLSNNLHSISFPASYFFGSFIIDYLSETSKVIIAVFLFFCLCLFRQYLPIQRINQFEYVVILLLSVLGVFLLCSANDLLTAYLSIELQSLAFYIIASFKKDSSFSIHAGLKYFILGALASCLFLFSSSIIYGLAGTINLEEIFIFLDSGSFASSNGCFVFFAQKLSNLSFFSFYYSFDLNLEDLILDVYFCLLEASLEEPFTFTRVENNIANILIFLNKCVYYGDNFSFNFMPVLLLGGEYIYFFLEYFYTTTSLFQTALLFFTGFFEVLMIDIYNTYDSFFFSTTCFNFFFLADLENSYILHRFELYSIFGWVFQNIVLTPFCVDLALAESSWDSVLNFFVLDMCFFYFRLYNLFPTILLTSAVFFLLFSVFFKLAVVPFNLWLPDVYEGALSSTTAVFAIIPKLSIFVFLFRLLQFNVFDQSGYFQVYFVIAGLLSIFYGSLIAIEERKLKSLIAFSAISNTGFLLVGFSSFSTYANALIFSYLFIYMIANMLIRN